MTSDRMLADKNYEHRVREGKKKELTITLKLEKAGYKVATVTVEQDMHDKVDAVVNGRRAQYKFRETGTDILFDAFEPFDLPLGNPKNKIGRDLASKAELYFVLVGDRLWMAEKSAILKAVDAVLSAWIRSGAVDTRYRTESLPGVELQWNSDHNNSRKKLIFFINPLVVGAVEIQ